MKSLNEIAQEISNILQNENVQLEFYLVNGGKQSVMGLKRQVGNRIEQFKPKTIKENPVEYSLTEFETTEKLI